MKILNILAAINSVGASIEKPWLSGSWGIGFCWFGKGRADPESDVTNFSYEKYAGDWYEIYRDKDFLYEPYDECVTTHYNYKPDEKKWKYWINTVQYTSWKTPDPWKIGYVDGNNAEPGSLTRQVGAFEEDGSGRIKVEIF